MNAGFTELFVMRPEHLRGLRRPRVRPLLDTLVAELRRSFPEELVALDEDELRDEVEEGALRAVGYGLVTFRDLARFLNLLVVYGWNCDLERPWMAALLSDGEVPLPSARLDRLVRASIERLRSEHANAQARQRHAAAAEGGARR
ncbi:MAG: hypothetical protein AAF799_17945 [Myxococcota bacterium]